MPPPAFPDGARIGAWRVTPSAGRLTRGGEERAIEPKVMDLLVLLAARPGQVVAHEEILNTLWPDTIVGDDTLARCVSKLRKAFDDDAKTPAYVETIAKRGYRLIADVELAPAQTPERRAWRWGIVAAGAVAVLAMSGLAWRSLQPPQSHAAATLVARAKDYYFQYTRTDNEAAIALYERVLETDADNAEALAGLATALVQRVLRWPNPPGGEDFTRTTLGEALADGRTDTPQGQAWLSLARDLAGRATAIAPRDAFVHQAHGLTLAASGDFDAAEAAYTRAVTIDADTWGALINLGDLEEIRGAPTRALPFYERAYAAMERAYDSEPQRIRLWHAELGIVIADRYADAGDAAAAEAWYRRVLTQSPLHPEAVVGLAALLKQKGDAEGAARLCASLIERTGPNAACATLITP